MKILSVVLLTGWLMIVGAVWATWISMPPHTEGVFTFVIGLAILLLELLLFSREHDWFRKTV